MKEGRTNTANDASPTSERPADDQPKPSVCFVAPKAYHVLAGIADQGHIGGAEVQQSLIARELVRRGYGISLVTFDHGQPDGEDLDGIRVWKMCRPGAGIPILRQIHPHLTSLWRAMRRANADVYYQRGAGGETGQVAYWCRRHDRQFVFALASDNNCNPDLPGLATRLERALYRYGLQNADAVIAQTNTQRTRLEEHMRRDSTVIRSCTRDPDSADIGLAASDMAQAPRILWIGRLSPEKRPELALEVAGTVPELAFDIVGNGPVGTDYVREVYSRARQLPNVAMHGAVPHHQMDAYYAQAAILLCTSRVEGVPNTFLEAWARGMPVVTTLDPDDVVRTHSLGAVANTPDKLAAALRSLLSDQKHYAALRERVRHYYLANHTVEQSVNAYQDLLARVAHAPPARCVMAPPWTILMP